MAGLTQFFKFQWKVIASIIAVAMALFHFYTGMFGVSDATMQRIIHLTFATVLVFFLYPAQKGEKINVIANSILIVLAVISLGYLIINNAYVFGERFEVITPMSLIEKILGLTLIILLLEATRRVLGWILPAIALVAILYIFAGPYLPGIFHHGGYSMERILELDYLTNKGIFGVPLGVSSTYIVLYVMFGAFLKVSGLGQLFMDIATLIAGRSAGGPAKVAVVSSGMMGSVSGSPVSNVLTTGAFTIPMMKQMGYKPHFAGAVEAVASTGGALMPPVMGSVAFIMSEFTGIPYVEIILYAALPAVLYYFSVYCMVHLEALKTGLKGLSKEEIPKLESITKNWHLAIPLIVLVVLLVMKYSAMIAAVYSMIAIFVVSFIKPHTRISFKQVKEAVETGAKGSLLVAMACAVSGIIIGSVSLSGVGIRFTSSIVEMSGGNIYLILILTAVASIVLGMGLPSVVSYMLLLSLVIPAISSLGINLVAAHLFCIYFCTTAFFTPPYCVAVFAATGLAGSDVMKTGFTAMRIGIASYIIPFMFIFGNELLLMGKLSDILIAIPSSIIGIIALSTAAIGYMKMPMGVIERLICIVAALLLVKPGIYTDLAGLICIVIVVIIQVRKSNTGKVLTGVGKNGGI